jgi:DNA-binding IclR family transcriptional regulator
MISDVFNRTLVVKVLKLFLNRSFKNLNVLFGKTVQNTRLETIMAELQQIKGKGYSRSYNNFSLGITSVSAPVKNKNKEIIAALELIGPEQRITPVSIQKYIN